MKRFISILLVCATLFGAVSCTSSKKTSEPTGSDNVTTPEATTPEQTTPEQTTPEQTTPEQTTPEITVDPAETYVIPADGKISLGDGTNGISYPFAAGVLTGLTGDNYAVASMGKLNQIKYFTKVVTPIGGFIGNWQLTSDSTLDMFTAGNYGDIQMFYHTDESNWVFGPGTSKGQTILTLIKKHNIGSCIYIGDTQGDLEACREANIPFIFTSFGFGQPESYYAKVDQFRDLLEVL